MKHALIITAAALIAAACTSLDVGQMQGHGVLPQQSSGGQTFRWAIPADAFDGLVAPDQQEDQRRMMLAQWLGREQACPGGYQVTTRTETMGNIVYEGACA